MSGVPRSLAKGNKKCPMPILKGPIYVTFQGTHFKHIKSGSCSNLRHSR